MGAYWRDDSPSFTTRTAFGIYLLRNDGDFDTIRAEARKILEEAQAVAEVDAGEDYIYTGREVPHMGIRVNVPKVEGMDTSPYQGWDTWMMHQRKIMHFEMEEEEVAFVQSLMEEAKNRKIFEKYFGPMARASNIVESKRGGKKEKGRSNSKIDISALASYCKKHVNYQMSTRYDGLSGIYDIDKWHPFYSVTEPLKVVGYLTLWYVMYKFFKMEDGSAMFHEIHQGQPMSLVDVVVANCAEADAEEFCRLCDLLLG